MQAQILDKKIEDASTCYLCKVPLIEYIRSIPETYLDFEVQRGIVANKYLDHIAETIHKQRHIPAIVLVANELDIRGNDIEIRDFRILDGLQRTHRLRVILDVLQFIFSHNDKSLLFENSSKFSRRYSMEIRERGADSKLVKQLAKLLVSGKILTAEEFFSNNYLWIEVWTGLSQYAQIEKMLLLNAGHKSVNIKHQLELLFLSTLFKLEDIAPAQVHFIREKDISSIQHSKNRTEGEYHFSHIISALVALNAGRLVQTNADFVSDLQSDHSTLIELAEGFNLDLIRYFIEFLFSLDKGIAEAYPDVGVKWIGREVVLVGIFGAIGAYSEDSGISRIEAIKSAQEDLRNWIPKLALRDFEKERNKVELNKVNVGNVNKRAVFFAITDLINKKSTLDWSKYFGGQQ